MNQIAILITHYGELNGVTADQIGEDLEAHLEDIETIKVYLNGVVVFDLYSENGLTRGADAFSAFNALCSALPSAEVVEHVGLASEISENFVLESLTHPEKQLSTPSLRKLIPTLFKRVYPTNLT